MRQKHATQDTGRHSRLAGDNDNLDKQDRLCADSLIHDVLVRPNKAMLQLNILQ